MAKAPATTKVVKSRKGDTEVKGKSKSGRKRTSIGNSRNSKPKSKGAVRNKKGRS